MENCQNCNQTIENCECHIEEDIHENYKDFIKNAIEHKEDDLIDELIKIQNIKIREAKIDGFYIGFFSLTLWCLGKELFKSDETHFIIFGILFQLASVYFALPFILVGISTIFKDIISLFKKIIKPKKDDKI